MSNQTSDTNNQRPVRACQRCGSPHIVTITPARPGPDGWAERCKDCGHYRDISAEAKAEADAEYRAMTGEEPPTDAELAELRARKLAERERQYQIDRITYQYARAWGIYTSGHGEAPRIEDYIRRHPQYAQDLLDFAVYFHTIGFEGDRGESGESDD